MEKKDPEREIRKYFNVPDTDLEADELMREGWEKVSGENRSHD